MRVLFVDDESNVLDAIRRQLRRRIDVHVASSGPEGLMLLEEAGPFAVVVSDMRMPDMSGPEFLAKVRERYPETVRMALSGQADLDTTIAAVNDGQIYRFLTKPCTAEALLAAAEAGIEQYRLVTAEKELLDQTLQGLVETLTDILGLTNPVARRRTARVRQYATAIARSLGAEMQWELRLATLLSQLGCITLPGDILDKLHSGSPLTEAERDLYQRHPEIAAQLVGNVPRLERVAELIGRQLDTIDFSALPADVKDLDQTALATVILTVAAGLDEWLAAGDQPAAALLRLQEAMPGLPAEIIEAVRSVHLHSAYMDIRFIGFQELTPGMVLDEDVVTDLGDTLMFRGEEITSALLGQLHTGTDDVISQKLRVLVPA